MRLEEIIPTEPKKKREYDHAVQCLEEAKKSGRRFIHISMVAGLVQRGYIAVHRGHIDAPSEYVYIWYNGVEIYIRADEDPVLFAFPLEAVSEFGDCDGSNPRAIWRSEVVKVKP